MKHKYIIQKNGDVEIISIKEYAELDKGMFSYVYEEKYDPKLFEGVLKQGEKSILAFLRTNSFFPPGQFAKQIARSIETLMSSPDQDSIELLCDDGEFLSSKGRPGKRRGAEEEDTASLEDFIEEEDDDVESDFDETVNTRDGVRSIKVDTDINEADDLDASF